MKALVIAGTTSGVGKTTIAIGLMGALRSRGMKVQPFKTGPDYIDPTYHTLVAGEPSRNLDTWMLSHDAVTELFRRASKGKDIAVIEGVMGLFDGRSSVSEEGSTAELAKVLNAPVILTMDSRKGARSLAAMASGYRDFDRSLNIIGVILNGIGSNTHFTLCKDAIEYYTSLKVLGYLPRSEELSLPERYLGLIPTVEGDTDRQTIARLIDQCNKTFDIDKILHLSQIPDINNCDSGLFPSKTVPPKIKIAIARDKAFSFYYQDSLELLQAWGAELASFSPLNDINLPPQICGIYIGGGFPELYAEDLAKNTSLKEAIQKTALQGMPVYAECGGLMYLGKYIRDTSGNEHSMVGCIPASSRIDGTRLSLGYRTIQALNDGPILHMGETVHGHEFHWSVLKDKTCIANAYLLKDGNQTREGFQINNLLASYIHLHLGSLPHMASNFITKCVQYQKAASY